MPTADASQFTTIKRYQTSINASLGASPLKFLVPSSFGGYTPSYNIGFLPANAIISNKEIVAPPTSEGTAVPGPQPQPEASPTGGGKTDGASPQQDPPPLQGTVDNASARIPPFSTSNIQAVSPSRKLISYKFLLTTRGIMRIVLVMANSTDRITNIKFTSIGGSQTFTDPSSLYQANENTFTYTIYYMTLMTVDLSDATMDITTENNIEGIGLSIL